MSKFLLTENGASLSLDLTAACLITVHQECIMTLLRREEEECVANCQLFETGRTCTKNRMMLLTLDQNWNNLTFHKSNCQSLVWFVSTKPTGTFQDKRMHYAHIIRVSICFQAFSTESWRLHTAYLCMQAMNSPEFIFTSKGTCRSA